MMPCVFNSSCFMSHPAKSSSPWYGEVHLVVVAQFAPRLDYILAMSVYTRELLG